MVQKIIFLIILILIIGCEKELSFTIENLEKKEFEQGIYYKYIGDNNVELILKNLIENNLVEEAWHKEFRASCCPPNTNRCMQAIVEPVFLVKLEKEIELEDFVKVEPDIEWCAYYIKYYKIK